METAYVRAVGNPIVVRYNDETTVYDPENFPLDPSETRIIIGSHLRLTIRPESDGSPPRYQARIIWIGD